MPKRPSPARPAGPEVLADMAASIRHAARTGDELQLVRGSRQYLLALLDHLDAEEQSEEDLLRCLSQLRIRRQLLDVARRLVLAAAHADPARDGLAERLAYLAELYLIACGGEALVQSSA